MQTYIDRRHFLGTTASIISGTLLGQMPSRAASPELQVQAVAFDAFPIFDPRPIVGLAQNLFPDKGTELANLWRTRQFEYTWLRSLSGRYADFWQVTEDALIFAARTLKVDLDPQRRARLMNAYLELKAWPDVPPALKALKQAGIRLAFLSNFSRRMLEAGIKNSGLEDFFEHVLSTDSVKEFKPSPRAYQMGVDAFGLKQQSIVFAAFAGWDASGAKSFGYPTVWVNRLNSPAEELPVSADLTCTDLGGLTTFATARR